MQSGTKPLEQEMFDLMGVGGESLTFQIACYFYYTTT